MSRAKDPNKLAKFLSYILGRQPDELGLAPDADGWVKVKELLQALAEEEGWRWVRRGHLNEVLLTVGDPPIQMAENRIRAADRSRLPMPAPDVQPPKLLFTCVRRRAHPRVNERGIFPPHGDRVVFSADRATAERIGRRSDPDPVVLTVNVAAAEAAGVVFSAVGDRLHTAPFLPAGCFTGPPLPKEPEVQPKRTEKPKPVHPPTPGSFTLDLEDKLGEGRGRKRREKDWKKERRRARKISRRR
jgi:putative RNA 2'-phosphotransferase